MPRQQITPEAENLIVATVRAGAYPHIAAEAAGVPRPLYRRWMKRGRKSSQQPYRRFYQRVQQARAHARLNAEQAVLKKDVKFWLRYGPGKEPADAPGWATAKARTARQRSGEMQDFLHLMSLVLEALTPHVEARLAVLTIVEQLQPGSQPRVIPAPESPEPPPQS